MKLTIVLCIAFLFMSCKTKTVNQDVVQVISKSVSQTSTDIKQERMSLSWESTTEKHPERASWSDYIVNHMNENLSVYSKASDVEKFCPKFKTLTDIQKTKALSEIVVGMTFYESGYNPLSRMVETTMGVDPVTGMQVASEGLLQLSYQDVANYKNKGVTCLFDYKKDKKLELNKRSILDPILNLQCGLGILKHQIIKYGAFTMEKNVYWAVIKIKGKYSKIDKIADRVIKNTGFCK
mgnify:CR=1 FL=1